jgi:hypothetical protein
MKLEEENARLRQANLDLQRRLERARRDALLYAASFCEDHEMGLDCGQYVCTTAQKGRKHTHPGDGYAAKLREIAK